MRITATMIMIMLMGLSIGSAATVDLNDGRVVQGNITKQDKDSIDISVDGVDMTYYADEIKDVDGKPFSSGQPDTSSDNIMAPAPVTAPVEIDAQKKALILKFIDVFGTRQALTNNFQAMLQQIQKSKPEEAQKIRERVKIDEIVDRLVPVYDRNFTAEDLKAFIAFYTSAEGQKLISTIPVLMKQSVQESVRYMEEKFPETKAGH